MELERIARATGKNEDEVTEMWDKQCRTKTFGEFLADQTKKQTLTKK